MVSNNNFKNKSIIIAGGGTGGHLFPALAIGEKLTEFGANVFYFGSKFGIESNILKNKKLPHLLLNIRGIQRGLDLKSIGKNLLFPFRFIYSTIIALVRIRKTKPSIVIGTGGYSSGIPLYCAKFLGIPYFLHEQNSYPGFTTRLFAKNAQLVFMGNQKAKDYLNIENYKITGNPIRYTINKMNQLDARKKLNLLENKFTIFFFGGSQGSMPINEYLISNYKSYIKLGCQLIWQCGENSYNRIVEKVEDPQVHIKSFINQMEVAYSAASLVICRSGAISLSELTAFGKAMILIPFPHAAGNHQEYNARALEEKNAAIIVLQKDLNSGILEEKVKNLIDNNDEIKKLEKYSKANSILNSTDNIVNQIMKIID